MNLQELEHYEITDMPDKDEFLFFSPRAIMNEFELETERNLEEIKSGVRPDLTWLQFLARLGEYGGDNSITNWFSLYRLFTGKLPSL